MDVLKVPEVITAIADPEFESLVSSALYSQGWNVIARAMDLNELQEALGSRSESHILIIYSSDLPGADPNKIGALSSKFVRTFGFSDSAGSSRDYLDTCLRPTSPEEFLQIILSNVRAPSLRSPMMQLKSKLESSVIAIGGARHSTGVTTLALNYAQESALLGINTLLIDANFSAPAISTLLDLRRLSQEPLWRDISPSFSVMEITQSTILELEQRTLTASKNFAQIVIDLGSVSAFTQELSDRRWGAAAKIWASRNADYFVLTSTSDLLSQKSFNDFMQNYSKVVFPPKFYSLQFASESKRGSLGPNTTAANLEGLAINKHHWNLPWDLRSCSLASRQRSTLAQVAPRSALRRQITEIATELTSNLGHR